MTEAERNLKHVLDQFGIELGPKEKMPFDIYRVSRNDLPGVCAELCLNTGVEVGVERGLYSEIILQRHPGAKLFCVDPWKSHRGYRDHTSQNKLDRFYEEAKERLGQFNGRATIIRGMSLDVVHRFQTNQLDFVYIDGNHTFDYVMRDIIEWSPKVRSGGIVAGHDFKRRPPRGYSNWNVIKATVVYTQAHGIYPWFTVGGGVGGEIRSWFWVKP